MGLGRIYESHVQRWIDVTLAFKNVQEDVLWEVFILKTGGFQYLRNV